jgi:hypothetical protein
MVAASRKQASATYHGHGWGIRNGDSLIVHNHGDGAGFLGHHSLRFGGEM